MDKENVKKTAKKRIILLSLAMLLPILIVVLYSNIEILRYDATIFNDYLWLLIIAVVLFESYIVVRIIHNILIITNSKYLEKRMIIKNDERNKYIWLKTNAMSFKLFVYILGVFTILSAFIMKEYFYLSAFILIGFIILQLIVYLIYRRKY